GLPADRIGPVEHHERRTHPGRGRHGAVHRPDVGVEPRAHVGDVEHHRVHVRLAQQFGELVGIDAVDVVHGYARARILVVAFGTTGLRAATETVFGAEHGDRADPRLHQ